MMPNWAETLLIGLGVLALAYAGLFFLYVVAVGTSGWGLLVLAALPPLCYGVGTFARGVWRHYHE